MSDERKVRLVLGTGEYATEIGVAEVKRLPDGRTQVNLTLDNSEIAEHLGLESINFTGMIPELPWEGR